MVVPIADVLSPESFAMVSAGLQTAISPNTLALIDPALVDQVTLTARTAFMNGMTRALFVGAIVMFASALFAWFVLPDVVKGERQESIEQSAQ